ncbi:MAG: DNA double-strand break repair protein Mre11 [Halolamina sp.]
MTRVIHTGDTHVGYRQYHSPERRADFRRAFEAVVNDAVGEGPGADEPVDAVVHAGDLFHDRRPELQDLMAVLSALRRLDDAGVPFLAVVGNHEATRTGQWLDMFESLGLATRLGSDPVAVGDTAFYGLDHVPEARRDELDYDFAAHDAAHAALVAHGLFTPFAHADWETETVLSAASVEFDAMLLGDNHEADTAEVLDTWVTYCGSTERASASERDPRGYNLVAFEDGEADVRRRSLADRTREFVFVEVDLAAGEGPERVHERVRQHDVEDAVVVVEVDGEGEPVRPATVEEVADQAGALLTRVTDRREREADEEVSVSFADPDEAVRERVAEMGLSTAARGVDEVVRESKTADANVRETVKDHVTDLLDEEPDAFEAARDDEAAESVDDNDARTQAEEGDADDTAPARADAVDSTADDAADDASPDATDAAEEDPLDAADAASEDATNATDSQLSMEDYT